MGPNGDSGRQGHGVITRETATGELVPDEMVSQVAYEDSFSRGFQLSHPANLVTTESTNRFAFRRFG